MSHFRKILLVVLWLAGLGLHAQKVSLKGNVMDRFGKDRLENATLSLFSLPNKELVDRKRNQVVIPSSAIMEAAATKRIVRRNRLGPV